LGTTRGRAESRKGLIILRLRREGKGVAIKRKDEAETRKSRPDSARLDEKVMNEQRGGIFAAETATLRGRKVRKEPGLSYSESGVKDLNRMSPSPTQNFLIISVAEGSPRARSGGRTDDNQGGLNLALRSNGAGRKKKHVRESGKTGKAVSLNPKVPEDDEKKNGGGIRETQRREGKGEVNGGY